ncbi:hypothetical protein BA895_18490 [Humibacillus sp. DSM 29435]|uniref:hypothetical protein n=1 Tax=Humibacillus sp. DSM 29435 TaxID=1869167 RepID=UPI0008729B9A|nr:hypothetical protein [Humibacillus sp. DSM 29435]OFE16961.1 hypothetical protein BA895_18490 [Humibacillus sp. DSM 29435]
MAWLSRNKKPSSGDPQLAVPALPENEETSDLGEGAALPEMGRYGPKVAITGLDGAPPELEWQLPINGELYKLLPGPDRPDYSVMVLERPLHFYPGESFDMGRLEADQRTEDRRGRPMVRVHALLLCARFVGQQLHPGMSDLPVNLAYVIDNSLARDEVVEFTKIEFAAVGSVSEGHRVTAPADTAGRPDGVTPEEASSAFGTGDVGVSNAAGTGTGPADAGAAGPAGTGTGPADAAGTATGSDSPSTEIGDGGIEPGELAEDGPPPMIVMGQVSQEAARTLRDGIAEQRGAHVENITATLTLDEQHRVTGLSGNADGQPPVPTPDTFERLNGVLAALNELPANHAVKALTLRVEGSAVNTDVDYRH